jgi:hypothetical protein
MTDNKRTGSTRREFVLGGSAAMLLVAGRSVAGEVMQVIQGTTQGAMPILSVGYWDGLVLGEGDETPAARIVRAAGGAADSRFSRSAAMVTVYGFWRAPQNRSKPVSLSLIALYPSIDPATGRKTPFVAWNDALTPNGLSGSLRSLFVVPVDSRNQIQLAVEKRTTPADNSGSDLDRIRALVAYPSAVLTFGPSDAPIALRRGFYVAALRERDIEEMPDWSRIQVTPLRSTDRVRPDGDGILTSNGSPVTFDYIVFLVEPYGVSDGRDPVKVDRRN